MPYKGLVVGFFSNISTSILRLSKNPILLSPPFMDSGDHSVIDVHSVFEWNVVYHVAEWGESAGRKVNTCEQAE